MSSRLLLLFVGISVLLQLMSTTSPVVALAAQKSERTYDMALRYQQAGVPGDAGVVSARVVMSGVSNDAKAAGNIESIRPAGGWNAVAYGTQTLVQCREGQDVGQGRRFTRCRVKVKMEKPLTFKASASGTIAGVTFDLGFQQGSGAQFIFFEGLVDVYRFTQNEFSVCPSWSTCGVVPA